MTIFSQLFFQFYLSILCLLGIRLHNLFQFALGYPDLMTQMNLIG
jgi:hypothetical protein